MQRLAIEKRQTVVNLPTDRKGPGRPKGAPNRTTRILKDAILTAAELVGSDGKGKDGLIGYLQSIAVNHPKEYVFLLSRVLPLQLNTEVVQPKALRSVEEIRAELRSRGLPQLIFAPPADVLEVEGYEEDWREEPRGLALPSPEHGG